MEITKGKQLSVINNKQYYIVITKDITTNRTPQNTKIQKLQVLITNQLLQVIKYKVKS